VTAAVRLPLPAETCHNSSQEVAKVLCLHGQVDPGRSRENQEHLNRPAPGRLPPLTKKAGPNVNGHLRRRVHDGPSRTRRVG